MLAPDTCCCHRITESLHELAEAFGRTIDAKDQNTKNHSDEVAVVAHAIALSMRLPAYQADIIHIAGHLHDVGKIGVPDAVLSKPGPLTATEWVQVLRHPAIGAEILQPVKSMRDMNIPMLVRCHHERWDGEGYPDGIRGENIPLGARIISVADSLSAMLQNRPYRQALSFDEACANIASGAGTQFDPRVVACFMNMRAKLEPLIVSFRAIAA